MQLSGCITEQFARAAADPQENLLGELATACAAGELDSLTANLMMVMLFAAGVSPRHHCWVARCGYWQRVLTSSSRCATIRSCSARSLKKRCATKPLPGPLPARTK
ncbi:putative cytochrome P450 144 domain protein [Mycobacterium ulcerans str. Harvey]|uniref:Cytochrome P450 144 domain protein n=1 Tax=Mycobacterium ulcerans str. Harvey TaxID=1299332 RepID=A0ABP3AAZ9_MYCUL|nr:putative cytochrome P450 144 domain protein [Mycobacterium ulcerans str. Harvey]